MIFVQPYGGVVLGCGVGVEPLIAHLHDRSVADSAAFVHANSIGATGWSRPAERSGRGCSVPARWCGRRLSERQNVYPLHPPSPYTVKLGGPPAKDGIVALVMKHCSFGNLDTAGCSETSLLLEG